MNPGCSKLEEEAEPLSLGSKTAIEERGKKAFAGPGSAPEKVRIYAIDSKAGRTILGLAPSDPIADVLFWYRARGVVVAVELKGSRVDHATKQLRRTIEALRAKLKHSGCKGDGPRMLAVVVYQNSSPPRDMHRLIKDFSRIPAARLLFRSTMANVDDLLDNTK